MSIQREKGKERRAHWSAPCCYNLAYIYASHLEERNVSVMVQQQNVEVP